MNDFTTRDETCLWHPYTQHGFRDYPLGIKKAYGAYLETFDGKRILDAVSSWWVNLLGHSYPPIVNAIQSQVRELDHVMFAGFTHAPAIELAETLVQLTQERGARLEKVFFSDNGSTSVEVALKMAFQGQRLRGEEGRSRFLALRQSYHGDTLGAMAVGEPNGFHPEFRSLLPQVDFIEANQIEQMNQVFAESGHLYAAFILEPLVQGAGGMRFHSVEFLKQAAALCQRYGVFLILDEVFTGFYRTGTYFAFEQALVSPDFLCLSKGLTGGFLPLAATLTSNEIYQLFYSQNIAHAFLHGHSYTANPIACAAALATCQELKLKSTQQGVKRITDHTQHELKRFQNHSKVKEVRSLGTIGVIELQGSSSYFAESSRRIRHAALEKGVLLRPLGNVIYTVPPYCTTPEELERIYGCIEEVLETINVNHSIQAQKLPFEVTDVS